MKKTYVRTQLLEEIMQEKGIGSTELAQKMQVDRTTVYRVRNGNPVGERFITGLMSVFPDKRFEDLFFCAESVA